MASISSREIIRKLEAAGWKHMRTTGSHHHFRHPTKPGTVTIPHPVKDLPPGTFRNIERQSGIRLR
jgi:predicted RNA binding protein YcfA (HicA-like mRNA interferase family)